LQRLAKSAHFNDPGEGMCQSCTVYTAEGEIEMLSGMLLRLCRSCVGVVRSKLKGLTKLMDKRAKALNLKRGVTRS
jgi:hypothetical protein